MRFDDSLGTVLGADIATPFGAQSAWRQLTDLIGRGRADATPDALARLRAIRAQVPATVRAASARNLVFAEPPAALVRLFGEDEPSIAAPVLSTARLDSDDWLAIIPDLPPASRSLLRHRRDMPAQVVRALASYGAADFALPQPDEQRVAIEIDEPAAVVPLPANDAAPLDPTGPFAIAELVARLDAYQRDHGDLNRPPRPIAESPSAATDRFRFETDAAGTIRWVEGVPREPLIGVRLGAGPIQVDGVVSGAFRRRAAFTDARLVIAGQSIVSGDWQISATPAFDRANGRFVGYRGVARRPRADERAEPIRRGQATAEAFRALVHELRTPTNAISGFAEMIEAQVLGPAPEPYRERAAAIRNSTRELLDAIDDVDTAARLDQQALVLRPGTVAIAPLLSRAAADLEPLMRLRGAVVEVDRGPPGLGILGDEMAVSRIVSRLLGLAVSASAPGERLVVVAGQEGEMAALAIDRPRAFSALPGEALFALDSEDQGEGAALLGAGFALRLARRLAVELGGGLTIGEDRLTLRLPAALDHDVGQLSSK
ncbi:MAG: HAMP domain-containing histidine kinase [Sphingomonas sp.]|uniref:sensor histidine kinase n=1 Tax=Sphingomonas sp. TaxID=28214 RepID=UPI001AC638DE|nr:HAMP domain-containing sensor histidine kinase [Sphingomonas sp.]MBN8814719.1 HAMP domain-containing histidine kinase [Sphingomonas sp.]